MHTNTSDIYLSRNLKKEGIKQMANDKPFWLLDNGPS